MAPAIKRRTAANLLAVVCAACSLGSDCNESLPPYEEPQHVFDLTFSASVPDPMNLRFQTERITANEAALGFDLKLHCLFDETLQGDTPWPLGHVDIWWIDNPSVTATLDIRPDDEQQSSLFISNSPVTLDPGDSAVFLVVWRNFKDDHDVFLWEYAACNGRSIAGPDTFLNYTPMTFSAQAWLQPIEKGPVISTEEILFSITFMQLLETDDSPDAERYTARFE